MTEKGGGALQRPGSRSPLPAPLPRPPRPQVLPLLHLPSLGKGQDLLTALVKANAPAVWYSFPAVRALHELHWGACPARPGPA